MNDDLARLEDERARLTQIAQSDECRAGITTSIAMFVATGIIGIISVLLIGAAIAGQLSLVGLFWSALLAGLIFFVLSQKLRGGSHEAMVADVVFGNSASPSENPACAQITEHDKRIEDLKMGKSP